MDDTMTGEQYERAVEAMAFERFMAAYERDVRAHEVAEKHWRQVSQGVRDAFLVPARRDIDAYHRSLREQGVVLVDLRAVVGFARRRAAFTDSRLPHGETVRCERLSMADAIERRFGGTKGASRDERA